MTAPEDQNGLREALARAEAERIDRQIAETEVIALREERDEARATNRELHRRLQAVEGPLLRRAIKAERSAIFWLERRKYHGGRAAEATRRLDAAMGQGLAWREEARLAAVSLRAAEDRAETIQATLDAEMEIQAEVRSDLLAAEAEITRLKEGMEAAVGALHTVAGRCELARSVYATEQTATPNRVAEAFAIIRDTANRTLATLSPKEQP